MVRKGDIACNMQFLLFSQCFLSYMALIFHFKGTLKCRLQFVSVWTSLKFCRNCNACNMQFLLFSQCFLPYMALIFHFKGTLKCRLQFVSIWTSLKFCRNGNGSSHLFTGLMSGSVHALHENLLFIITVL